MATIEAAHLEFQGRVQHHQNPNEVPVQGLGRAEGGLVGPVERRVDLTEVVEHAKVEFVKIRSPQLSTKWARGSTGLRRPRRGRTRATFRSRT